MCELGLGPPFGMGASISLTLAVSWKRLTFLTHSCRDVCLGMSQSRLESELNDIYRELDGRPCCPWQNELRVLGIWDVRNALQVRRQASGGPGEGCYMRNPRAPQPCAETRIPETESGGRALLRDRPARAQPLKRGPESSPHCHGGPSKRPAA